jgi:hypothetical protein
VGCAAADVGASVAGTDADGDTVVESAEDEATEVVEGTDDAVDDAAPPSLAHEATNTPTSSSAELRRGKEVNDDIHRAYRL